MNCSQHQRIVDIYCESCERLICRKCLIEHKTHSTVDIDDYVKEIKNNSKNKIDQMKLEMDHLRRDVRLEGLKYRNEVEEHYERQIRLLDAQVRELIDQIHFKHVELKRQLKSFYEENNEIYQTKLSQFEFDLKNMESFVTNFESVNEDSSDQSKIDFINGSKFTYSASANLNKKNTDYHQCQVNFSYFNELKSTIHLIDSFSYINESEKLTNDQDQVITPDSRSMNRKELLLKSIELDPGYLIAHFKLAFLLGDDEKIQLNDGVTMANQKSLLLNSLKIHYQLNGTMDSLYMRNCFNNLALALPDKNEKVTLPNGEKLNQRELFLKSIELDPLNFHPFFNLALKSDSAVQFPDGSTLTKKQLYIRSIELNPTSYIAYSNLGALVGKDETAELLDGRKLNKKQLYIQAIKLQPNYAIAFRNLSLELSKDDKIKLEDGRMFSKRDLLVEAVKHNPSYSLAYNSLGAEASPTETIQLADGRKLTKKQLYLEAIRCDKNNGYAHNNLGLEMKSNETIELPDGKVVNCKQLYIEAIRLNPKYSMAYSNLGYETSKEESIELSDGRKFTKKQLFIEAIKIDEKNTLAYHNLGSQLGKDEVIELPDGRKFNKEQLLKFK